MTQMLKLHSQTVDAANKSEHVTDLEFVVLFLEKNMRASEFAALFLSN
jgi:hypothetical protein